MAAKQSTSALPQGTYQSLTSKLTRRELEVLFWLAQGKRDREIATILGISYRTVTNHVRAILAKLEVENRTAAVGLMQRQ